MLNQEEGHQVGHGHVGGQATHLSLVSQDVAEVRRKKDQLLAKMREIDDQNHVSEPAPLGRLLFVLPFY